MLCNRTVEDISVKPMYSAPRTAAARGLNRTVAACMNIPRSGKHQSARRKTSIRDEENTNPRKERSNSQRNALRVEYSGG